jgi:hypothetical protein
MIVISSPLVLSLSGTYSENLPVIGWQNLVSVVGITADYEEAEYPATNLANVATNLLWKSGDASEQYIEFEIATEDQVDYIGVARHNFGSGEIIVSVEYLSDDESPEVWTELVQETLLPNDNAAIFRFEPTYLTHAKIRLRLQPQGTVEPQAAVAYVGRLLVMPRSFPESHTPVNFGTETDTAVGESDGGEYLGAIIRRRRLSSTIDFQFLNDVWYRANMADFVDFANRRNPFFFAWNPGEHPTEVGFSWLTSDAQPSFKPILGVADIQLQYGAVA